MTILKTTTLAAALAAIALPVLAAELPEGTVIGADNIDKIKNDTFQGHTIASLLTERMEWRIRNNGLRLPLAKSKEVALDSKWVKATQANAGKTKINRQTCMVDGWGAGQPFPNVDEKDPEAAEKIIWNWHLGQMYGDVAEARDWTQLLIDGAKGIHAEPTAEFSRFNMKGRLDGKTEGDGSERGRQLLFFKSPADMKGLGTFTVMFDSAKVNDVWAYIPAVRRVRRLSGGAWMDPIGSSDQLQDDLEVFNARPCWYTGYKLLGKRWVLAAANSPGSTGKVWNKDGKTFEEKYPALENKAPFWNMNNDRFEPREVYVIEAITPPEHPYSKKVLYMETKYPRIYWGEAYNRKGEFWKHMQFHSYPSKAEDGSPVILTSGGAIIDFQRNHATVFLTDLKAWKVNTPGVAAKDFTLEKLQAAGR